MTEAAVHPGPVATWSSSRADVLRAHGATDAELPELLHYTENVFTRGDWREHGGVPLADEPFVAAWERYATDAATRGAAAVLRDHLVQLRFPIAAGMSDDARYCAATRRGEMPDLASCDGIRFVEPDGIRIFLHATAAGRLPIVVASAREDFVALVQALTRRNEPADIPASMGACIVAGYNNWDRVGELRRAWASSGAIDCSDAAWWDAFRATIPDRERYQDRFVLLSSGAYSATAGAALGVHDDAEWLRQSLVIRLEHECAHYVTRRAFGSMRNTLLDELIADHAGITAACGRFHAAWFLRFVGLEDFPRTRAGGRLEHYRGAPPLGDAAFAVVRSLVAAAAATLHVVDDERAAAPPSLLEQAVTIGALTRLGLEALAGGDGVSLVHAERRAMYHELGAS